MLIGSMSSLTPRFSTQVSPSCSDSSNSNPYCMPEQPPPCTNTRSLRFGLPSPRIRSPTLRAAASVKTRVSMAVSVMLCTLRAGLCGRNLGVGRRRRFCGFRRLGGSGGIVLGMALGITQRNQLPGYDGARRHFNDPVVHIAVDPGLAAQDQALAGVHVAVHGAVHDDAGHFDGTLDEAAFAHRQGAAVLRAAAHVAVHPAVEVQAAGELQVTVESGRLAQKRVDARRSLFASPEHEV